MKKALILIRVYLKSRKFSLFLQTQPDFALKSLGIHKGFLRLFALNPACVCEISVIFFVFRYTLAKSCRTAAKSRKCTKIKNIHGHLKAMYKYQNNYSSETSEPGSCPRATVWSSGTYRALAPHPIGIAAGASLRIIPKLPPAALGSAQIPNFSFLISNWDNS